MKIYDNGFIGHNESSVTLKWAGSDTLENFVKNKKNMPYNWYYNTNSFTYERNSLGHRSKEIKDLDFDNYILQFETQKNDILDCLNMAYLCLFLV